MSLTNAQRKVLETLSNGPAEGRYGHTAYPKGLNGHCLETLSGRGLVESCDGATGRKWSITDAGRKALE